MTYDPDIHKRRSIRLKDYDYSQTGAYFVTICTKDKECLFGDIADGKMLLNQFGVIAYEEWLRTEEIRQGIKLDGFTIMPNHFHGILLIDDNGHVGARRCLARFEKANRCHTNNRATHRIAPTGIVSGSVGAIIGQFKTVTTKQINRLRNTPGQPVWQRNYYEHIIRNENELHAIRQYIFENPLKWDMDNENPSNNTVGATRRVARIDELLIQKSRADR